MKSSVGSENRRKFLLEFGNVKYMSVLYEMFCQQKTDVKCTVLFCVVPNLGGWGDYVGKWCIEPASAAKQMSRESWLLFVDLIIKHLHIIETDSQFSKTRLTMIQ